MRLTQVRVQNYRCVRDTGWFDVEQAKTILVGPNEAGKTAVLEALQQINAPAGAKGFDPLRDYPRKLYNADIQSHKRDPSTIPVASARFALEPDDLVGLPDGFSSAVYCCTRYLDNRLTYSLEDGPEVVVFSEAIRKDLRRLATHVDSRAADSSEDQEPGLGVALDDVLADWRVGTTTIAADRAADLRSWLDSVLEFVDEKDAAQDQRHSRLLGYVQLVSSPRNALQNTWAVQDSESERNTVIPRQRVARIKLRVSGTAH